MVSIIIFDLGVHPVLDSLCMVSVVNREIRCTLQVCCGCTFFWFSLYEFCF